MSFPRAYDPSTSAVVYAVGALYACLRLDYFRFPISNFDNIVRTNNDAVVAPSTFLWINFRRHAYFTPFSNCLSIAGDPIIGIVVAVSLFVGSVA